MVKEIFTRKELVIKMLEKLKPDLCYAKYIAAKMDIPAQNVSSILTQLLMQGKVTKIRGSFKKIYYKLK